MDMNSKTKPEDSDDICPATQKSHVPDWSTLSVDWDGGKAYVDVNCKDCGRSGCVGNSKTLAEKVNW